MRWSLYARPAAATLGALITVPLWAVANALLWDAARQGGGVWPWIAPLAGYPWLYPSAPLRFLLFNLPIWGLGVALAYALIWQVMGRAMAWWRLAVLWAVFSVLIFAAASLCRAGLVTVEQGAAALVWAYVLTGVFLVRDRACR